MGTGRGAGTRAPAPLSCAAIVVTTGLILLGMNRPETPELVSPATQPAQPPVIATEVVTPPPVPSAATPPPPAVLVVTPVPTPEADAGEADERDVLAPWVYYFPTKWVPDAAEWRESFRWQDPLPTIEPPLNWEHDTWRTPFPTFEGYRDRLFIRAYGYTYAELTPQHEADMRAIFRTHHELLPAWMKAAGDARLERGLSFPRHERTTRRLPECPRTPCGRRGHPVWPCPWNGRAEAGCDSLKRPHQRPE